MNHLLDNFMKYASSDEDDEDEYFGPPGMTDEESKAKYDRLLATSRKLRGVGFYTTLAGSGLSHVAPEIAKSRARAEMSQSAKLRAHHRARKNPNGLMLVTPGMAQTGQKAGRFGRGVSLAGALMIGAGQASAGIAHRKRINYLEHALREKNKDQEKTAGDVVDFSAHAKKVSNREAIKTKLTNPTDPIRDAQGAIQEYLNKEKEWQAESQARKSKIAELEMGFNSDMEQIRQIEDREAKTNLRGKKIAVGAGIGTAATIGGLYAYNRYKKKKAEQSEQEKTAAPMFGKKRYKPRTHNDHSSRLYHENDLNRYKKFSNAPDFDEAAYKKSEQAVKDYYPTSMRESGKSAKNFLSSLIAVDMARRGGLHALSGNKPAAKRFGVAAGLASIYPAYRGMEGLKRRYHFSKEKNIEADKAERVKDDAAISSYKEYLTKYNGGENGWYSTGNTLSYASKHALVNEAKKKNSRIQYNDDYSTNFVSPKGKKSKRRWENAGYLDEDDFDDSDISLRRLSKKTAEQEKTARSTEGWDLAEEERLGKLWDSPEYKKKEIDELRANYRKVGQEMPGDVNRRHRRMKIGALAVGGMAVGLGAQKLKQMYAQKKKQEEAEKTAATKPSFKKLYESDSKLKDAVFGAYKKGPDKGANKFNVAYKKKQILKSWKNDVYKSDEVLDGKIQQRHKDNYDDAFVEAAARPIAIAAGTGAAIYGGKKLLDRYNKRQAEKKEQNYYV